MTINMPLDPPTAGANLGANPPAHDAGFSLSPEYREFISLARGILKAGAPLDIDTPFLIIDLDKVTERFELMERLMPSARIFYAVKANSNRTLLKHLKGLGSGFDVASAQELFEVGVVVGASPDKIVYTHPLKDERALQRIKEIRPGSLVVDSIAGLRQLTESGIPGEGYHPRLLVRVQAVNSNLNKFGVPWLISDPLHPNDPDATRVDNKKVCDIFCAAAGLPAGKAFSALGVAFHVGTQTVSAGKYTRMLGICRNQLIDALAQKGISLSVVDIGGGFPDTPTARRRGRPQEELLRDVEAHLKNPRYLPQGTEIFVEPGRFLTADAGVIISKFISRSEMKGYELSSDKQKDWGIAKSPAAQNSTVLSLTLDDSLFNNLAGQEHDAREWNVIPFELGEEKSAPSANLVRCLIFGATCDGFDELRTLRKEKGYWLPQDVSTGTLALVPCAGAYTNATASEFNGFPHSDVVSILRGQDGFRCIFDRAERRDSRRADLREVSLPGGFRG